MQLNQIVKINESGMVADAVNFGMMANPNKNLRLCQGFVFNYNNTNPKSSTLGVLDAIQKSYQSVNQANIHLLVQDYGKGKSHLALVIANYFKLKLDSPEVEGILNQIKIASGDIQGILEDLTTYKRRNPKHLVICISGDSGLDLRQIFLRSLNQTLEVEGITEVQQFCQKPLEYLNSLTEEEIKISNDYLRQTDNQFGDINNIIELLKQDNYKVISTVKEISSKFNPGCLPFDFETDLSIESILQDLINKLCTGQNAKYSGILILFDELNCYLKSWATDSVNAGGASLQNITNICENNESKIALVCFTQIRPSKSVPSQSVEDYKKLASRLEIAGSTYEPSSSLELVIKGLLNQQFNLTEWNEFKRKWSGTLLDDSRKAHETRINIYRDRGWTLENFNNNLTLGCFPLHPLNSYLLCNLDFTQGRTAIQYIKEDVKKFINSQPVEKNNRLNYFPAISLVDAFESNFSQPEFYRYYSEYKKVYSTISSSATEAEIAVLKALFLFYVSQNKLRKPESEKHDIILSELTGLSAQETKTILDKLSQQKQVIYKNDGDNTYRFYPGSNLLEISQEIEEETIKQSDKISVNLAVDYCQKEVTTYLQSQKVEGASFIDKNQLLNDEWFFEYKFYSIEQFKQALSGCKTMENIEGKGIFAYILAETIEELQDIRHQIDQLISQSKHKERFAIAIPNKPVRDICRDLLKINIITRKGTSEKQEAGTALSQLSKQLQQKIGRELKQVIIAFCTYHCNELDRLTTVQQRNPESIVSYLLQQLYYSVPPIGKESTLTKPNGTKVIGYATKRLLEDDLNPTRFPEQSYSNLINQVFVRVWGLFKTTPQKYSVQIPTNNNVRKAWDRIDILTALGDKKRTSIDIDKIWNQLSNPPFGYNEHTFTMLFAAWIAYHRSVVMLRGSFGIPKKKEQLSIQEKPIKDWALTNVFDKPKDFINIWILASGKSPQLIRSQPVVCPDLPPTVDYDKARKLIEEITQFINSADPDQAKVKEISPKKEQLIGGIKKIDDWFIPIQEAENLPEDVNLDTLLNLFPRLQQSLPKLNNSIVVNPTKQQDQRRDSALQKVQNKIEENVNQLSNKSVSLKTQEECVNYINNLQKVIEKITQVGLPSHLIERINNSCQVATTKLNKIQHEADLKKCLEDIEARYKVLSNNANQDDYINTLHDIEELANKLEIVKQESRYQEIIINIERELNNLEQIVTIWSERLTSITKNEAFKLHQEISNQQNRFTKTESSRKVKDILDRLYPIILEIQNEEVSEIRKQEQDNKVMDQLRQKNPKILNTFILCQQGVKEIATLRLQLNYPERFSTEIEQLISNLDSQLLNFQTQLENIKERISQTETNEELYRLQTDLAKLDIVFKDSDDYLSCQGLQQEVDNLRSLFQITQQPSNTNEVCQNQLQILRDWYVKINNCTPNLQTKYHQYKSKLEQKIEAIEIQCKNEAESWLNITVEKFTQIQQKKEDEKLKLIDNLLKNIKNNQAKHFLYFDEQQKELLKTIKDQCINIQNESQENQIITLFTQLPPHKKQNLYSKLEKYLSNEEENNE